MGSRLQVRLLALCILVVTISTLPVFLTGAAFFQIGPELGLGPVGLGVITGAFFLTAAAASAPLGRWVQRVGWRRAMRTNVVASAVLTALVAPLASTAWSLGLLLIASAVMYGSSNPAANQALALHTDPQRSATVFGLKHAGIPASTLLAGLAVPVVVLRAGWRAAFLLSALVALLVWFLIPRAEPEANAAPGPSRGGRALARSDLRRLASVAALGAVAAAALGTFLVSAAIESGLDEAGAGWLQFAGSGASIGARIASGLVVDRGHGSLSGLIVLLGAGSLVFLAVPLSMGVLFVVVVMAAYATGWGWPGLMTATVVDSDRNAAASRSAITQAGVFFGAGGAPLVLGVVAERWSFDHMWLLVAGCLAVGAVLALSVAGRRSEQPST